MVGGKRQPVDIVEYWLNQSSIDRSRSDKRRAHAATAPIQSTIQLANQFAAFSLEPSDSTASSSTSARASTRAADAAAAAAAPALPYISLREVAPEAEEEKLPVGEEVAILEDLSEGSFLDEGKTVQFFC